MLSAVLTLDLAAQYYVWPYSRLVAGICSTLRSNGLSPLCACLTTGVKLLCPYDGSGCSGRIAFHFGSDFVKLQFKRTKSSVICPCVVSHQWRPALPLCQFCRHLPPPLTQVEAMHQYGWRMCKPWSRFREVSFTTVVRDIPATAYKSLGNLDTHSCVNVVVSSFAFAKFLDL